MSKLDPHIFKFTLRHYKNKIHL